MKSLSLVPFFILSSLTSFTQTYTDSLHSSVDSIMSLVADDIEIIDVTSDTVNYIELSNDSDEDICEFCVTNAEFPGGQAAMIQFISQNLRYPYSIIPISGFVQVQFIVEKNGSLSGFRILRSLSPVFDEEAIRVLSLMPKWSPAYNGCGNAVRQYQTVPVVFRIT